MKRKGWFELTQPQRQNTKVVLGNKILGEGFDLYFGADDDLDEDTDNDDEKGLIGKGRSQFTNLLEALEQFSLKGTTPGSIDIDAGYWYAGKTL